MPRRRIIPPVTPDTPVGAVEVAARLGVKRATVDQWRQRGVMPAKRWTVGGRPAWAWSDIEAWAIETGRMDTARVDITSGVDAGPYRVDVDGYGREVTMAELVGLVGLAEAHEVLSGQVVDGICLAAE